MNKPADLYEQDFVLWAEEQARALRQAAHSGANLPLDWGNLAEEIESLGRRDRRELRRRIRTILIHLLKLDSPGPIEPRRNWKITVRTQRAEIQDLLHQSPSLRREVAEMVSEENARACELAAAELEDWGDGLAAMEVRGLGRVFTEAEVLTDWWPPEQPIGPAPR